MVHIGIGQRAHKQVQRALCPWKSPSENTDNMPNESKFYVVQVFSLVADEDDYMLKVIHDYVRTGQQKNLNG